MRPFLLTISLMFSPHHSSTSPIRTFLDTLHPVVASPTPFSWTSLPIPWQCIAFRESTDNLRAINPVSGDVGAFQFALGTWNEYRPATYPSTPLLATLQQQYEVALAVEKKDGFSPWVTAKMCGLH